MSKDDTTAFVIPESVEDIDDLAAAETEAREAAEAISADTDDDGDLSNEQLDQLDKIGDHIDALHAEAEKRDSEAAQRRERAEAARKRISGETDSTDPDAEPDADADEGDDDADGGDPAPVEGDDESAPEAVAASAKPKKRVSTLRRQPHNPTPAKRQHNISIVAAAGLHVEAGHEFQSMEDVAKAFAMKTQAAFPQRRVPDMYQKQLVASLSRDMDEFTDLDPKWAQHGAEAGQALLDAVADERRLDGGNLADAVRKSVAAGASLAAAGGWCAPSITDYSMVEDETTEGLVDVPEAGITRGGVRFTLGPDFADIFTNVGFAQTEAEAIAGDTKDCYEVECPDFDEVRLDAVGICVKAGLLTNAGYPELVARVLRGAMVAHQQKVSQRIIASMVSELGTAVTAFDANSTFRSTLTGLEVAAEGIRNQRRLGVNTTLEVVLPHWLLAALRDDLQNRGGDRGPVTDAELAEHFASRHLRVQFVYGFGDSRIMTIPGGGTLLHDFPDTAPAMIYPAGTFVKGVQNVINLSTVYDSTDLQVNTYTGAFVEEGVLLAKRGWGGGNLTLPVKSTGRIGARTETSYGATDS